MTRKWSVGVQKLARLNLKRMRDVNKAPAKIFTFEEYSAGKMFANDGYTFLAVVRDNSENSFEDSQDITVFITNNQTLNICFLGNKTCKDYFRAPALSRAISNSEKTVETSISNEPQLIDKTKSISSDLAYESYEDLYYVDEDFSAESYIQSDESQKYNIVSNANKSKNFFKL
jgi:hypothetical protein